MLLTSNQAVTLVIIAGSQHRPAATSNIRLSAAKIVASMAAAVLGAAMQLLRGAHGEKEKVGAWLLATYVCASIFCSEHGGNELKAAPEMSVMRMAKWR